MRVDLRTIPVCVISGDPRRADHIRQELHRVDIHPILNRAIPCSPGWIGCALSHLKLLRYAPQCPFLVLEDDCSVSEAFSPILDIPEEAEAVYLGVSTWGMVPNYPSGVNHSAEVTVFDEGWLRVHNMLSAHAILYLSEHYVELTVDTIVEHLGIPAPFDIGTAKLQSNHVVLTPKKPFFYQDGKVGGAEDATKNPLMHHPI